MKIGLALYAGYNSAGKKDSSGAFTPEAKRFAQINKCPSAPFDNRLASQLRKRDVEQELLSHAGMNLDYVAFFCHGMKKWLQTGHDLLSCYRLADVLKACCKPSANIVLYACSTGSSGDIDGEGGFADCLRDSLVARGFTGGWLDAHTTAGHATKNPAVRRFPMEKGLYGGKYLYASDDKLYKAWAAALKTDFRFEFPFLKKEETDLRLTTMG